MCGSVITSLSDCLCRAKYIGTKGDSGVRGSSGKMGPPGRKTYSSVIPWMMKLFDEQDGKEKKGIWVLKVRREIEARLEPPSVGVLVL